MSKPVDIEKMHREYRAMVSVAETFCLEMDRQFNFLFKNEDIALANPIQYRVKQWESLENKFVRMPKSFRKLKDVQDLVGLRVILLFKRDVEKVCQLIHKHFEVIKQYDTSERLKEDQFGYSSIHFIVSIPERWLDVPSLMGMQGMRAEVQVRTIAQHIWAEASNKLQYKQEDNVPMEVKRSIYLLSAQLEMVDRDLENVLHQRDEYRKNLDISNREAELNVDLLEKTLDSLLPAENKEQNEPYSEILEQIRFFQIDTPEKLTELVNRHLETVLKKDSQVAGRYLKGLNRQGSMPEGDECKLEQGVFFTHALIVFQMLRLEFGKKYQEYLIESV